MSGAFVLGERHSVEARVREILAVQLGVPLARLTPNASLMDDLGADSLSKVEIVMALEDAFRFEIPDVDARQMVTVQDVLHYVMLRCLGAAAEPERAS